ncbi:MAG: SHOCT domain-containing protein [Nitrospirota bacterium]
MTGKWHERFTEEKEATMHFNGWGFLGMHVFWWLFWVVLILALFGLFEPVPRRKMRETPLQVLQRRYAAGEISTQEYEERKQRLERDVPKP